jgi:hypothetical protein
MSTRENDVNHLREVQEFIRTDPRLKEMLRRQPPPLSPVMRNWLARLELLYGVSLEHLVPDERQLPMESIRFFHVDPNWLNALRDGALSPGRTSSLALLLDHELGPSVRVESAQAVSEVRGHLRREALVVRAERGRDAEPGPQPQQPVPLLPRAGLLLRSALIADYPGLEVRAYRAEKGGGPIAPLRVERLAADLLFCLFPEVPARVEVAEPPESLQLGLKRARDGGLILTARYIDDGNGHATTGNELTPARTVPVRMREPDRNRRVLDVWGTWQDLKVALREGDALDNPATAPPGSIQPGAAALAIQLISASERVSIQLVDSPTGK